MNTDSQLAKALFGSQTQTSSPTTEKIQAIEKRKKEEWKIEAKKEQYRANSKNYFNLTKRSEEQAKSITYLKEEVQTLKLSIQKLEQRETKWKCIAFGIFLLATIQFSIFINLFLNG